MNICRRQFLSVSTTAACLGPNLFLKASNHSIPGRPITKGPRHHWFGYYDKWEFDPSNRFVLGMEVDFENRSPRTDDRIKVGMVDLHDHDRWIELGSSQAWNWQQGCMLQWRPGSADEVLWNDRDGDRFVCHVLNVKTREKHTLPFPIYTISPDGRAAMSVDFERIQDMRPGYGYAGILDPHAAKLAPANAGIYRVDLDSGKRELAISLAEIAQLPYPYEKLDTAKHYFNHLLFNTDGSRFIFLHRWRQPESMADRRHKTFGTRMLTATPNGDHLEIVDDFGYMSHFIWRDPSHILAWTRLPETGNGFYLFHDGTRHAEPVGRGIMTSNGHCTYLPGNQWILNDTYPDRERYQHVYLFRVDTQERIPLNKFPLPPHYTGEWRVDTHPRRSRDGKQVVIDSVQPGQGRQLYWMDISEIVG